MPIVKNPCAKNDVLEIWEYIASNSTSQADAFIDEIDRLLSTIAQHSDMGRVRNDLLKGLKSFPIGKYIIFYRVILNGIELIRVFHSARDIDADLFSEKYFH